MQMLRTFAKDAFRFGLASWRWLGISGKTPRFTTCFGDVFLESLEGWWFLDTMEGTLELRWTTAVDMYAELEAPEGRTTYLMDDVVRDAEQRGLRLGRKDVFTFNPHPALGGDMTADNLTTMRFSLALNWAGTMHEQLRQVPTSSAAQPQAPAATHWVHEAPPVRVDTAHPVYAEPHPPTGSFAVTGAYGTVPPQTGAHYVPDTGTFPHYAPQQNAYEPRPATGSQMTGQHMAAPGPHEDPRPYVQAGDPPAWDDIWRR
ncbi:T6SS immunity protein Tdi1 domain-containing protein [Myceligenerans indicum]|uniref:T6SS immunity protein Tdi1 domain-containing protein n=1 Tax=Myceligenerans indicum TaxID=2593663 RepID=UPI00191CB780|nr:T6SS immunity protein Tdi1 domain-containing protein [Myceligenerans indicum]